MQTILDTHLSGFDDSLSEKRPVQRHVTLHHSPPALLGAIVSFMKAKGESEKEKMC